MVISSVRKEAFLKLKLQFDQDDYSCSCPWKSAIWLLSPAAQLRMQNCILLSFGITQKFQQLFGADQCIPNTWFWQARGLQRTFSIKIKTLPLSGTNVRFLSSHRTTEPQSGNVQEQLRARLDSISPSAEGFGAEWGCTRNSSMQIIDGIDQPDTDGGDQWHANKERSPANKSAC